LDVHDFLAVAADEYMHTLQGINTDATERLEILVGYTHSIIDHIHRLCAVLFQAHICSPSVRRPSTDGDRVDDTPTMVAPASKLFSTSSLSATASDRITCMHAFHARRQIKRFGGKPAHPHSVHTCPLQMRCTVDASMGRILPALSMPAVSRSATLVVTAAATWRDSVAVVDAVIADSANADNDDDDDDDDDDNIDDDDDESGVDDARCTSAEGGGELAARSADDTDALSPSAITSILFHTHSLTHTHTCVVDKVRGMHTVPVSIPVQQ
jgi:hypothetical protein